MLIIYTLPQRHAVELHAAAEGMGTRGAAFVKIFGSCGAAQVIRCSSKSVNQDAIVRG